MRNSSFIMWFTCVYAVKTSVVTNDRVKTNHCLTKEFTKLLNILTTRSALPPLIKASSAVFFCYDLRRCIHIQRRYTQMWHTDCFLFISVCTGGYVWNTCWCVTCACSRVSPLSLAVDGSSRAICSASSDRESSTGRALRRDMDSLRLMIFILSIFETTPPGPTGLRECKGQEPTSWVESSGTPCIPVLTTEASALLAAHWLVDRYCTVQCRLQCSLCAFSAILRDPNNCVSSRGLCSHCYGSQEQTLQNKRHRMWERTHRDTENGKEREQQTKKNI